MADRLKDIWSGFSQTTERKLTGRGVDNIIVPERADYDAVDRQFLPDGFESPAEKAFAALRADLDAKGRKANAKKRGAPARAAAGGDPYPDEKAWGKDDLNVGLLSTAMRVERTELDYQRFLASDAGRKALKKSRKKRFGLF